MGKWHSADYFDFERIRELSRFSRIWPGDRVGTGVGVDFPSESRAYSSPFSRFRKALAANFVESERILRVRRMLCRKFVARGDGKIWLRQNLSLSGHNPLVIGDCLGAGDSLGSPRHDELERKGLHDLPK